MSAGGSPITARAASPASLPIGRAPSGTYVSDRPSVFAAAVGSFSSTSSSRPTCISSSAHFASRCRRLSARSSPPAISASIPASAALYAATASRHLPPSWYAWPCQR